MKKINFSITVFILFSIIACQEEVTVNEVVIPDQEINNEDSAIINIKGLREFSLKENELEVTILVPEIFYTDEDDLQWYTPPEIIHNDGEARWEIKMPGDKYWHLVIEDMGDELCSVAKEKETHNFQKEIFDFKYHNEDELQLLYSKILKSDNTTLDNKEIEMLPNYHFYCIRKIGESTIIFRSFEMGDFRKPTIDKMLASALSSF